MFRPFLAILACSLWYGISLHAQSLDRYMGTWRTYHQSAPFERIVISPPLEPTQSLQVHVWYPCSSGLCSLKNLEAMVIGGPENSFLVLDIEIPGNSYSFPTVIFPTFQADYLNIRVKKGGDYTQLFTFSHQGPSYVEDQVVANQKPNSEVGTINDYFEEQGDNLFGEISPEVAYESNTSFESSAFPAQVASSEPYVIETDYYPSQEPLFGPEFEEPSAGSIILSHCYACRGYQLKVYNSSHTYYIDPEQNASRRWECVLPALNPGVYRLTVIWRDDFSNYSPPPYIEDTLQIEPGDSTPVQKVLRRN